LGIGLKKSMPAGRPSDYSVETAATICTMMAEGTALVEICQRPEMPHLSTVYRWLLANAEFREMYAQGREWQADTMADRAVLMATKGGSVIADPATARVQLDAIKWAAAKFNKKYADKTNINLGGQDGAPPVQQKLVISWEDG
jgi:hypothetical protein